MGHEYEKLGIATLTSNRIRLGKDGDGNPVDNGAILMGGGSSSIPIPTSEANKNFIEYRVKSTATTAGSDTRLAYFRLYLNGITTGGGECMRIFTTVNAAVGTAHGAHISLNYGASGSCSGQGIAMRATLHLPTGTQTGNVAAVQAEIFLDAAGSIPPTEHALFRGVVSGNVTLVAGIKNLINLVGVKVTAASSGVADMVTTGCADSTSDTEIKIRIKGVDYWLLATATQPAS